MAVAKAWRRYSWPRHIFATGRAQTMGKLPCGVQPDCDQASCAASRSKREARLSRSVSAVRQASGRQALGQVDLGGHFGSLAGNIEKRHRPDRRVTGAKSFGVYFPTRPEGGDDSGAGDNNPGGPGGAGNFGRGKQQALLTLGWRRRRWLAQSRRGPIAPR